MATLLGMVTEAPVALVSDVSAFFCCLFFRKGGSECWTHRKMMDVVPVVRTATCRLSRAASGSISSPGGRI